MEGVNLRISTWIWHSEQRPGMHTPLPHSLSIIQHCGYIRISKLPYSHTLLLSALLLEPCRIYGLIDDHSHLLREASQKNTPVIDKQGKGLLQSIGSLPPSLHTPSRISPRGDL